MEVLCRIFMALPEFYISSSMQIVNVDTSVTSKILYLPPASTVVGQTFTIRDATGNLDVATRQITVTAVGADQIVGGYATPTVLMESSYQSITLYGLNTSNYVFFQNNFNNRFWLQPGGGGGGGGGPGPM
jgi:hypothetical protein